MSTRPHLAGHLGISQAGVIEQAIRKLARAELPSMEKQKHGETPQGRQPKTK
jgi:hypothetical protein